MNINPLHIDKKIQNRTELAKFFNELGFKVGAEVGACFGRYSKILCENIPGLKLTAIDSWDTRENTKREAEHGISGEQATRDLLAPFDVKIIRSLSMEALEQVEDGSLDFVFIDADHSYKAVKEDINGWSKKVRAGGIVSGHDYYVFPGSGNTGVIDAVNEYCRENGIELQTTEWDKKNPERDDRQPCWFYFKK